MKSSAPNVYNKLHNQPASSPSNNFFEHPKEDISSKKHFFSPFNNFSFLHYLILYNSNDCIASNDPTSSNVWIASNDSTSSNDWIASNDSTSSNDWIASKDQIGSSDLTVSDDPMISNNIYFLKQQNLTCSHQQKWPNQCKWLNCLRWSNPLKWPNKLNFFKWSKRLKWLNCLCVRSENAALLSFRKLQKATGKQCKLFTSVSIEQENKRRTTHLHFLITVVSNSVRTVSFAYSGKVEKNFRLNKPYISVSMEQEKNRQRSCFHAISNYLGIRLENAAIARSGKL